jgi:hypothetical protein
MSFPGTDWLYYSMGREWTELTVWLFLFGAYVDSPSPPLDDASAADLITGIHVFRAPCVWIKTRLKERRRTTGFQIARPPLKLSCRLRPCDGCGHEPDESQGGQ